MITREPFTCYLKESNGHPGSKAEWGRIFIRFPYVQHHIWPTFLSRVPVLRPACVGMLDDSAVQLRLNKVNVRPLHCTVCKQAFTCSTDSASLLRALFQR